MPANEFEKQVQERLDELQLIPSASVWKNVEDQIRKKKRRRILFLLFIPLFLGMSGLLIWKAIPLSKDNNQQSIAEEATKKIYKDNQVKDPKTDNQGIEGNEISNSPQSNNVDNNIVNANQPVQTQTVSSQPVYIPHNEGKNLTNNNAEFRVKINQPARKGNSQGPGKDSNTASTEENEQKNEIDKGKTGTSNDLPFIPQADTSLIRKKDQVQIEPIDSMKKIVPDSSRLFAKNETEDQQISELEAPGKDRKWLIGIDGSIGATSKMYDLLSFPIFENSQDFSNSPSTGSGSPGTSIAPSLVKPGASFRLGIIVERQLSSRFAMSSGFQYAFQSTRIKTGVKKDTVVLVGNANQDVVQADGIYTAQPQKDYSNQYHFIRIPLDVQWQVHRNLPLHLSVGASASYLVKTNALIYSPALGGLYYRDNDAYNKLQFGLSAGMAYSIKIANGSRLQLGPAVNMNLTSTMKSNRERPSYLFFGGINLRYYFPEKKKY